MKPKLKKPKFSMLLVSLLVHIAFIVLISLSVIDKPQISNEGNDRPTKPSLRSYLLFPKPPPKHITLNKNKAESIKTRLEKPVPPKDVDKLIPIKELLNNSKLITRPKDQSSLKSPELTKTDKKASKLSLREPVIQSSVDQKYGSLVSKHLAYQRGAYNQQQAREYRSLKTSPLIDTSGGVRSSTIILKRPVVAVDCTNTASKIFAAISPLVNGTVECANNDTFQLYIDKRLDAQKGKLTDTDKEH